MTAPTNKSVEALNREAAKEPPKLIAPVRQVQSPAPPREARPVKQFHLEDWSDHEEGEKVLIYGESGYGKTTLAATSPNPTFIGVDDGGRKIPNPITGVNLRFVPGIESFYDIRDALHQASLFPDAGPGESSIVLDTVTMIEQMAELSVFDNYRLSGKDGNGTRAKSLRDYGWGEGYFHLLDQMRLLMQDMEIHVKAGRNIILICQKSACRIANAGGADYIQDGPALYHDTRVSVRQELIRWSDHVFKVDLKDPLNPSIVVDAKGKPKAGKLQGNTTDGKAIYTGGAAHFVAKSRPVKRNRTAPYRIPLGIPFESPADRSLWEYIFDGSEAA